MLWYWLKRVFCDEHLISIWFFNEIDKVFDVIGCICWESIELRFSFLEILLTNNFHKLSLSIISFNLAIWLFVIIMLIFGYVFC